MKVNFSDAALRDLEVLRRYLEDRDPGAAANYGERFEKAVSVLEEFPNIGRLGDVSGTREYTAVNPYIIIYQIDAEDDVPAPAANLPCSMSGAESAIAPGGIDASCIR